MMGITLKNNFIIDMMLLNIILNNYEHVNVSEYIYTYNIIIFVWWSEFVD